MPGYMHPLLKRINRRVGAGTLTGVLFPWTALPGLSLKFPLIIEDKHSRGRSSRGTPQLHAELQKPSPNAPGVVRK